MQELYFINYLFVIHARIGYGLSLHLWFVIIIKFILLLLLLLLNVNYIVLGCKLFVLVCQGLNVNHKSCGSKLKSSIGGPFNLESLEVRPIMMVTKGGS